MTTILFVILIALLVAEFVTMSLMPGCLAVGVAVALVLNFLEQPIWMQIAAGIAVSMACIFVIRPVLARYINESKKQSKNMRQIGADAIVLCEIDNNAGVGVVNIAGREWAARSHRPNAVIPEGSVVTVVAMRGDVAIVDDHVRRRRQ